MAETTEAQATRKTRTVGPIVIMRREAHTWVEQTDQAWPDSESAVKWIKEKAAPGLYRVLRQTAQLEVTERNEVIRNVVES